MKIKRAPFGVPITFKHPWVLLGLIGLFFAISIQMGFAILLLFLSLMVHEYGHMIAMRSVGSTVFGITVGVFNAYIESTVPKTNIDIIKEYVGGPLATLLLSIMSLGLWLVFYLQIFWIMFILNIFLLLTNILPIPPLDGGMIIYYWIKEKYGWCDLKKLFYVGQITSFITVLTTVLIGIMPPILGLFVFGYLFYFSYEYCKHLI